MSFYVLLAELGDMLANFAKTHILHFWILQSQYHICDVPNFFLGSNIWYTLNPSLHFFPTQLQKEKENIPFKMDGLPQVTLLLSHPMTDGAFL